MNKKILKWGAFLSAGLLLLDMLLLETLFFEVNTFNIGKSKGTKKIKLLLLTDLHFKRNYWIFHKKLVNKVNALKPDLILIAGDLVDEFGTAAPAAKFLQQLDSAIPKIGIMGNHDHKSEVSLNDFINLYERNKGFLLVNESKLFEFDGNQLMITGLDDFIEGKANFYHAIKGIKNPENHLLLIHSPKQQEKVKKELKKINEVRKPGEQIQIQYIFAGHNHGGQVRFLAYAPVMPEKSGKYMNGWYNKKPPFLYVSKGFGTSTLPLRFLARSEVTVFNWWI